MPKSEFLYDYDEDLLYVYRQVKSYGSIEWGENIIIDFDKKLNITALEFFNASKILSALTGKKITKKLLSTIKKASLVSEKKGGLVIAYYQIWLEKEKINEKLSLQDINYKSPVLARCK